MLCKGLLEIIWVIIPNLCFLLLITLFRSEGSLNYHMKMKHPGVYKSIAEIQHPPSPNPPEPPQTQALPQTLLQQEPTVKESLPV